MARLLPCEGRNNMRLLIITQKVDTNDSVLGFFHGWIAEFAKQCTSIVVICLEKGAYQLPANVRICSLGKEERRSRWSYMIRLYKYMWSLRGEYDAVFVHMNQEYVLLGGLLWKCMGKPIFMWRNHAKGTMVTRIAVALSSKVFCTSPQSFTARFAKTSLMPVGIDTELFSPDSSAIRKRDSIVCLGRISPVKKIEDIIVGVAALSHECASARLIIVGDPTPDAHDYYERLKRLVRDMGLTNTVSFEPAVRHDDVPVYYQSNEIYVNATPAGSADKTIFEAMACGTLVVVRNEGMVKDVSEGGYAFTDGTSLAATLKKIIAIDVGQKNSIGTYLRTYVMNKHSLTVLASQLISAMKEGAAA